MKKEEQQQQQQHKLSWARWKNATSSASKPSLNSNQATTSKNNSFFFFFWKRKQQPARWETKGRLGPPHPWRLLHHGPDLMESFWLCLLPLAHPTHAHKQVPGHFSKKKKVAGPHWQLSWPILLLHSQTTIFGHILSFNRHTVDWLNSTESPSCIIIGTRKVQLPNESTWQHLFFVRSPSESPRKYKYSEGSSSQDPLDLDLYKNDNEREESKKKEKKKS